MDASENYLSFFVCHDMILNHFCQSETQFKLYNIFMNRFSIFKKLVSNVVFVKFTNSILKISIFCLAKTDFILNSIRSKDCLIGWFFSD